jgi:hypothetical protein
MTVLSMIGLLILIIGAFLIGFGFQKTQTLTNKVIEGVTGHYTQRTIWILVGGGLLILIGAILIYAGWKPPINLHP